jgi:hypothetical protein
MAEVKQLLAMIVDTFKGISLGGGKDTSSAEVSAHSIFHVANCSILRPGFILGLLPRFTSRFILSRVVPFLASMVCGFVKFVE